MFSQKAKIDLYKNTRNIIQNNQAPIIVSSTTNFISEVIQSNSPNSETNFISKEKKEEINDNKNNKRKTKQAIKIKDNILVLNKNKEKTNNEIYNHLMKNEDMNNIQNIKELHEIYSQNQIINFIYSRLNKNLILNCNIFIEKINKSSNYILYSHSHKFILSAKYDFSLFHNNYIIYISRNFLPSSAIANLHSYSQKSEFILYDMGKSPKYIKNNKINTSNVSINFRKYLLQINYLNDNKFQNLKVFLPKNDCFQNYFFNMDENHKDKLNNKNLETDVIVMENSKPKYDINSKKFIDNYSNRVKEKSKYNFKIIYNDSTKNDNYKAIECGKINENNYVLDIGYPLSPLEGFAVALSNFIKNQ